MAMMNMNWVVCNYVNNKIKDKDKDEDEDEDNRPKGKKKRKHGNEDDTETTMIELQHTQENEREIRQSIAERVVSNTLVYLVYGYYNSTTI